MENKIPTAEAWVNQQFEKQRITTKGNDDIYCSRQGIIEACQIFAKLHVEAALEATNKEILTRKFKDENEEYFVQNKDSIINAYQLENIKF